MRSRDTVYICDQWTVFIITDGSATCEGYPGTDWDHQEADAKTFAEWEVDSVKVDGCNSNSSTMNDAYPRFGDFLNHTGRPMLYSCSWPDYLNDHVNFSYVGEKCNLWRMFRDIYSQWPIIEQIIEFYGDQAEVLQPIAGPGRWNVRSFAHAHHATVPRSFRGGDQALRTPSGWRTPEIDQCNRMCRMRTSSPLAITTLRAGKSSTVR
eukprot:SAG31_NODE_323_length_17713_cov_12.065834_11_plen_208_part_00